jgi:NADPH:quinone reductase-like Zn-dependent oxidoreductase
MTIKRSRAELFSYIGAPLNNVQWSWGAVRETDGSVFLVVWQDENLRRGTQSYSLVHNQEFWGDTTDRHGHGTYKAKPAKVFRFDEIQAAHRMMESGSGPGGKLVVKL